MYLTYLIGGLVGLGLALTGKRFAAPINAVTTISMFKHHQKHSTAHLEVEEVKCYNSQCLFSIGRSEAHE